MKAKLTILVFVVTLFSAITIKAQDFNLFNPSNELYLFSAYDEGSNAFRYNPAVLGLGHRLNLTINAFLGNMNGRVYFDETDFTINSGSFALGIRRFGNRNRYGSSTVMHYSGGFGVGNKSFTAGISIDAIVPSDVELKTEFDWELASKYRFSFGFLYRPSSYISTALVFKTNESYISENKTATKYILGLAVRPLKSDILTLMADLSIIPYYGNSIFKYNSIRTGLDIKITKGTYLKASYTIQNTPDRNNYYFFDPVKSARVEYFTFGLRFDFPNSSITYNNPVSRMVDNYYKKENPLKSIGNQISMSYNVERRKSIIPEKKKIVEITLSGSLQDYNTEDVFFGLLGKGKRSIHEVIGDIDYAAVDPSVKGMILKIYPLASGRFEVNAAIEELTASMTRFRSKNKTITVYFPQDVGPGGYYISTFADDIVMPAEAIFFYGLSINVFNYNSLLEKYGVDLQTFYAGKYKLTFQGLLDSTTEEGKEVINRVLDIVYEKMLSRIVTGRNLTLDDYLLDKLSQPLTGSEAYRLGLVDKLGWYEDAKEIAGKNSRTNNVVRSFNRSEWETEWSEPPQIAVIGVYASITTGESEPPPPVSLPIPFVGGGRSTGSETVVKQLEDAFSNPKIKAIVLRVDSGGGSALGSAEINAAIIRLKKKYKKPFIVSMGGAAASGGYYVSANADKIFSDELTITGSIGVFTARPNLDSLLKGQKIKVENFKRGENSDIGSFYKELDEKEIEIIQGLIDYYYDRFTEAVAEGRKMSREEVEQVAQGRVWLGTDAFNKKLVDEIGGLYEAVKFAKKKSGISGKYKIVYYAVPGGNKINEIMTASVIGYFQSHLIDMLGIDETNSDGLEIKY
jgi:protease-4